MLFILKSCFNQEKMERAHIFVSGIVQGVYYRYNAMKKANQFNLKGWVRNLIDGRVEIVCEGKRGDIEKFIEWCKKGPPGAYVEKMIVEFQEFQGEFDRFEIRY